LFIQTNDKLLFTICHSRENMFYVIKTHSLIKLNLKWCYISSDAWNSQLTCAVMHVPLNETRETEYWKEKSKHFSCKSNCCLMKLTTREYFHYSLFIIIIIYYYYLYLCFYSHGVWSARKNWILVDIKQINSSKRKTINLCPRYTHWQF